MDTYEITANDLNELSDIDERLQRLIGRIIGREEAIRARRDQFKLIDITAELAKKKRLNHNRQKRNFWNSHKRRFQKCRHFSERNFV